MTVVIHRARRGLLRRPQFRVSLLFDNGQEFAHTETYTNRAYAVSLANEMADRLGADVSDWTKEGS